MSVVRCRRLAASVIACWLGVVPVARGQESASVEWREGRLRLAAEKVPLSRLLREIARQTGIEVRIFQRVDDEVSANLTDVTLPEGLKRLLVGVNYCLVEKVDREGGSKLALLVLSSRSASGRSSLEPEKPEGDNTSDEWPNAAEDRLARLEAGSGTDEGALSQATLDPSDAVRAAAFGLLARHDPGRATKLAVEAAHDADVARRLTGLQALGDLDDPRSVETLGEALAGDDEEAKEYAIHGLFAQKSPEATRLLRQALEDREPSIRLLALETLASRGAEGSLELETALGSGDAQIRARASELLRQLRADEGSSPGTSEGAPIRERRLLPAGRISG